MRKVSDPRVGRQSHSNNSVNLSERPLPTTVALRTALRIAERYPVFPCDPQSKRPLTEHGFKEATQDPTRVGAWWRRYPEALIGVPMGASSGLVAIDVDPEGRSWLRAHQGQLGLHRLHQTRRGKHLLYQMNGTTLHNSASVIAPGIDVRGEGGYIV